MKILALQPWDRGSHRAVRESISRHSQHEWMWLTRKGRSPRWRLRYAGLEFARETQGIDSTFDAVFATSMCSLADFRATASKRLRTIPHVLYMHENQAAYPVSEGVSQEDSKRDVHLVFTNLSSIEAADRVLWNSSFNQESFIDGVGEIFAYAPEPIGNGWLERLRKKSSIVWPPVEVLHNPRQGSYQDGDLRVAWPHRWEHDKGCEELLALIERYPMINGRVVRWVLLGERQQNVPEAMKQVLTQHAQRVEHFDGKADRETYLDALGSCEWVASTARHEFFGIAVCEALMLGCLPWLPERLSYPELLPEGCRGLDPNDPPTDPGAVRKAIGTHLEAAQAHNAVRRIDTAMSESQPI